MQTDLPQTGPQQTMLQTEAERVIKYATQYVGEVRANSAKESELFAQRLQKQQAEEATARGLLEEFVQLILKAEAASEAVRKAAEPLDHVPEPPAGNAEILRAS